MAMLSGIYFTLVMSLTSLSVLLAVGVLNVHLYGSALRPVPPRLRRVLIVHIAPLVRVRLHRSATANDGSTRRQSALAPRRLTTLCNAVLLHENERDGPSPRPSPQPVPSETRGDASIATAQAKKVRRQRLLSEGNRRVLSPVDEEKIIRDWQNIALVIDRCLFYAYIVSTTGLTALTLVVAPMFKTIPKPPNYFLLNVTRD